MTGIELETFIISLNAELAIDQTLLTNLVEIGRAILEEERPWMVLRKTDTSKSATPGNTWQTEIDLSSITDFSGFYSDAPIILFDGDNRRERYRLIPFDRRLDYKDVSYTACYDENSKKLYLNGLVPYSGTLYLNYVSSSTAIDLISDSDIWPLFPSRFTPILGFYAIGINKGAIDYDSINRLMLPENRATLNTLREAMEEWDNKKQANSLVYNDPSEPYSYPRDGAIDRYDNLNRY